MSLPGLECLSPAFRLLLACARHPLLNKDLDHLRACLIEDVDWVDFLDLVERHRIHPQVLVSLGTMKIPDTVHETLIEKVQARTLGTLGMLRDLVELVPAMAVADIPMLVLKGPPLSQLLFQDLAFRSSRDLDLLVSEARFEAAVACLETRGCERVAPSGPMNPRQFRRVRAVAHHIVFHTPRGTAIELHAHADHAFGIPDFLYDTLPSPAYVPMGGVRIPIPPTGALLTYLCIHGSSHQWSRLKWLCDIEAFLKHPDEMCWEDWIRDVRGLRLERIVTEAMTLATHFLGATLPPPLQQFLDATPLPHGFLESSLLELRTRDEEFGSGTRSLRRLLRSRWHTWQGRPGTSVLINLIREVLVDPDAILAVDLPTLLTPAYPLIRVVLWLWHRNQRIHNRPSPL